MATRLRDRALLCIMHIPSAVKHAQADSNAGLAQLADRVEQALPAPALKRLQQAPYPRLLVENAMLHSHHPLSEMPNNRTEGSGVRRRLLRELACAIPPWAEHSPDGDLQSTATTPQESQTWP